MKWIGAILVIAGCGGFGFHVANNLRRQEKLLRRLMQILEYMACELEFRQTALPELCRKVSNIADGAVQKLFLTLAGELERQVMPDAAHCMDAALEQTTNLPGCAVGLLRDLGKTLGSFDLAGQLKGLAAAREQCIQLLTQMEAERDVRLRSIQTLGLCGGAALAILFI